MNTISEWITQHPEIAAANKQAQDDLYCELSYADRDRGYPLTQRMLRRLGLHPDCRRGSYSHIPTPKENEIITEYARLELTLDKSKEDATRVAKALRDLVAALAANDEEGLIEHADVMTSARSALKEWDAL